jgi:signal transduction histidine kinase
MAKAQSSIASPTKTCDLSEIISDAVQLATLNRSENLVVSAFGDETAEILFDRDSVLRMVFNLVRNAVDAIGEGPGLIRIDFKSSRAAIEIDIRDNGPGIPGRVLDRLFPNLAETKPHSGPIGLGLPSTAEAAASLGGQLILVSTGDRGTHFRIRLPHRPVRDDTEEIDFVRNGEIHLVGSQ